MDTKPVKFPPMRRRERELSKEAAERILEEGEYGILATCGEDGWPYGVPLSYVWHEGKLYFHGAVTGHKLKNLAYNEKASFTVVGRTHVLPEAFSTAYQSAVAFGCFRSVEPEKQREALMLLARKYCPDNLENAGHYADKMLGHVGVYWMEIVHLTGKARPDR